MKKLFLLGAMLISAFASWADDSPYTGVALADITDGTSYYLYNVDLGKWLGDNDRNTAYGWTSHAEIGSRGRDIKFIKNDSGWQLDPKMGGNHSINANGLYMDTSQDVSYWTFTAIDGKTNCYEITSGDYNLGANSDGNTGNYDTHNVWQIVTRAERLKYATDNATADAPADLSWTVLGGNFPVADDYWYTDGIKTWTYTFDGGNNVNGGDGTSYYKCNRCFESWNSKSFDAYTTISDLPNGTYMLNVQGYYRDGAIADFGTKHTNGTEVLRAKYYANDKEATLQSIIAGGADEKSDNRYYYNADGKWVPDGLQAASAIFFEGGYWNEPIKFLVTDGTAKIGWKKEGDSENGNWTVVDNFTLKYYGTTVSNADTSLKAAIDYMSGRGYTDEAANKVLATSTNATDIDNATAALKIRFKQSVADKSTQPTQFTTMGNAVVGTENNDFGTVVDNLADGFYIYNVGTGRWFCGGDDWGAHAAVGFPGIKVTTPQNTYGTGNYNSIVTWLCNGNWGSSNQLDHNGYCDTGGNGWKFWAKDADKGIYTISRNGSNTGDNSGNGYGTSNLLGFSNTTLMRVNTNMSDDTDPNNQWIFVTEAQRDAMATAAMASATKDKPVDLTYKIAMPGFNQRERNANTAQSSETLPWTCNHANYTYDNEAYDYSNVGSHRHIIYDRGANHADFCVDVYGPSWKDAFSLKQTIKNLTPGKYRVKVQGYNWKWNGDDANKARLVANDQSVVLRDVNTETILPWKGAYAQTTFDAVEYFENGLYWNQVECSVGVDGELTIGVESTNITDGILVYFDNFRLEYIGGEVITLNAACTDGENVYGTYSSSKALVVPSDLTVATVAVNSNGELTVNSYSTGDVIPANTGVMVSATKWESGTKEFYFTPSSEEGTSHDGNCLKPSGDDGVTAEQMAAAASGTYYRLTMHNGETIGFWWGAENGASFALAANKAYLVVPSILAKSSIWFGDETSAINAVESTIDMNAPVYNIQGQRVAPTTKGILIQNGRKYFNK